MATIDSLEIQISANALKSQDALKNLINSLSTVSSRLTTVGTVSTQNFAKITSNVNKLGTAISKVNVASITKSLSSLYVKIGLIRTGADQLLNTVKSSMDYIETLNYFNAAFGQVADSAINNWSIAGYQSAEEYYGSFVKRAKELTSKMTGYNITENGLLKSTGSISLGINPNTLMQYQAQFAQMSSSIGISAETSLKLSDALTQIGADLASVKNMDFNKVWEDMASGLAGMSRTLDKYGVNIRNVNLQEKLHELGINANIQALNQNDKALLRAIILLDSTRYAWGDLSDTLEQPANQFRMLQNNFSNLARTIGNLFLPVLAKTLPYINAFVVSLQNLADYVGELAGFEKLDWTSASGSATSSFDELFESVEDTTKAVDNLQGRLRGFDKLNVISSNTSTSYDSLMPSETTGLLEGAFDNILNEYQSKWNDAFSNMEQRYNEFAKNILLEPLKNIFKSFAIGDYFQAGQDISNLVVSINEFLTRAIQNVDWEQIGENVGDFIAGIEWSKIFSSFGNLFWEAFSAGIEQWKGALKSAPIETTILSGVAAMPIVAKLTSVLSGAMSSVANTIGGSGLFAKVTEMFALWSGGAGTFGESFMAVFGTGGIVTVALAALAVGLGVTYAKNEEVRESFKDAITTIGEGFTPMLELISGTILPDLQNGWNGLLNTFEPLGEFLNTVFVSIWQDMLNPSLTYLGENVLPILTETLSNLWNNTLVPLGEFIGNVLNPTVNILSDGLEMLWESIVVPLANAIGNVLGKSFEGLARIFNDVVIPGVDAVITILSFAWDNILEPLALHLSEKFGPVLNDVFSVAGDVIEGFGTTLGGLIDFVTGAFAGDWEVAWEGIVDIFKGVFNGLGSVVEGVVNFVIDGVNDFLEPFNDIVKNLGDTIGLNISFGKIPKIDIPQYATGGFPEDGLFFANHNELVGQFSNGQTAVANNEQITKGISDAVYPAVYNAITDAFGGNRNAQKVVVQIDGREVFSVVRSEANNYTRRTGQPAFGY